VVGDVVQVTSDRTISDLHVFLEGSESELSSEKQADGTKRLGHRMEEVGVLIVSSGPDKRPVGQDELVGNAGIGEEVEEVVVSLDVVAIDDPTHGEIVEFREHLGRHPQRKHGDTNLRHANHGLALDENPLPIHPHDVREMGEIHLEPVRTVVLRVPHGDLEPRPSHRTDHPVELRLSTIYAILHFLDRLPVLLLRRGPVDLAPDSSPPLNILIKQEGQRQNDGDYQHPLKTHSKILLNFKADKIPCQ
jgi:hypothetical protein